MKKYLKVVIALLALAATIAEATPAWVFEGQWPPVPKRKLLRYPCGVASRADDEFYVTDSIRENSRVWHLIGSTATWWGGYGSGPGQFNCPNGIALAPNGNVYVVDAGNFRVQYFTSTGSFLGMWPTAGEGPLLGSGWIAVAPNGNVYVTHVTGSFVSYYTSTGSFLGSWGWPGSGPGAVGRPYGIAVGPNNYVYVVDGEKFSIKYYTLTGSFLGVWGGFGIAVGVAASPDGRIFITCPMAGGDTVRYYTATGSFLGSWGGTGKQSGQFNYPSGIAISPSGKMAFVVDRDNWRVQWFREQTTPATPASLGRVKALYQ